METAYSKVPFRGPIPLETFLGGMETVLLPLCGVSLYHLETFLGGMETGRRALKVVRRVCLETFLGGMETFPTPTSPQLVEFP